MERALRLEVCLHPLPSNRKLDFAIIVIVETIYFFYPQLLWCKILQIRQTFTVSKLYLRFPVFVYNLSNVCCHLVLATIVFTLEPNCFKTVLSRLRRRYIIFEIFRTFLRNVI